VDAHEAALKPSDVSVKVIHVNSAEGLADLRAALARRPRANEAIVAIASDEYAAQAQQSVGRAGRGAVVNRSDLPFNQESGLYSYDDVLTTPRVARMPAVQRLVASQYRDGQMLVISRTPVPFGASEALARIIEVLSDMGDGWRKYNLGTLLEAATKAMIAA
jgi:hypothetical protein